MIAAIGFGMTTGARPMAMRSSVTQFDAALAYARALAATSGNGATLLLTPRAPVGFLIAVYSGRPTAADALSPAGIAPLSADGDVAEATLGKPPFAIYLNSAGHASMARTAAGATPSPTSEPACPPSGQWMLTFSDARTSTAPETRLLHCLQAISSSPE
jgi:hypothetical protein